MAVLGHLQTTGSTAQKSQALRLLDGVLRVRAVWKHWSVAGVLPVRQHHVPGACVQGQERRQQVLLWFEHFWRILLVLCW